MLPILLSALHGTRVPPPSLFDHVSTIHVPPAPNPEARGFHSVIAAEGLVLAVGIRGELVAVNISEPERPRLLLNRQAPVALRHARSLAWVPGRRRFVLADANVTLYDGSDAARPRALASVPFPETGEASPRAGGINGLVLVQGGDGALVLLGAAMNGSVVGVRLIMDGAVTVGLQSLGLRAPTQPKRYYDVSAAPGPSGSVIAFAVTPGGSRRLLSGWVARAGSEDAVLPPPQWGRAAISAETPPGWPAATGCNRVRAVRGAVFISCYAPALNNVLVLDTTKAEAKIVANFSFVDEQPTGMLVVGRALLVAGGRDLMAFDITRPLSPRVLGHCGTPCRAILPSAGQNAHSLAHLKVDGRHLLCLTAQIDNNLGLVQVVDPDLAALMDAVM